MKTKGKVALITQENEKEGKLLSLEDYVINDDDADGLVKI